MLLVKPISRFFIIGPGIVKQMLDIEHLFYYSAGFMAID
jgi:hypothetical protein